MRQHGSISRNTKNINGTISDNSENINGSIEKTTVSFNNLKKQVIKNTEDIAENRTLIEELQVKVIELGKRIDNITAEILPFIQEELAKLKEYVQTEIAKLKSTIEGLLKKKAGAMYYDANGELDPSGKSYWYMSYNVDDPYGTRIPGAGPYDFGSGGGGGGGVTKVTIEAIDWPTTIAKGAPCTIQVYWTSLKEEVPTGNGTISVYVNNSLAFVKRNTSQGYVDLDITDYLTEAINMVEVRASDSYGSLDKVINEIDVIEIKLASNFDNNKIFSGTFNYTCIPTAAGTKTLYYYVDGVKVAEDIITTSGEQVSKTFSGWSHGAHKLEVYFKCMVGETLVESNHLTYDIIYEVIGDLTPIIASSFNDLEQEQYISFSIPYRAYTPGHNESHIELLVNDVVISTLDVNQSIQYWSYKPNNTGLFKFTIKCQNVKKEFNINVKASEVPVTPVKENLALALNTIGRSNAEPAEERVKWEDKERHISCTLTGFNFASDGWVQDSENNTILRVSGSARVEIPYKVFDVGSEIRDTGKTIEIEIATSEIMNYEAVIMSCWDVDRGFYITPQLGVIKSQSSYLQTQYKEDDHVRLTFVIEKKNENRLILMYINGIMSGAVRYPENDDFSQNNPKFITIGSDYATIDIYNIRVYDNNLDRKQVVNNWIADTQSGDLKKQRYLRNDNYNTTGEIDITHLPSGTPYIIWDMDVLPEYKGDKRPGNAEYVDSANDTRNFKSINATYNVQGTSSAVYPVKNIRIKYKKNKDWPDLPFSWTDKDGKDIKEFAITTPDGIGDNYFTYKVDFASSEGANNVELTKLYNDASKNYGIKTPPQKLDSKIRVGIDGFPIVAFHKGADNKVNFCTKANFNNDKANEKVYGFETGDESWEITNNTADEAKFKVPVTKENFEKAFEIRFPDEDGYSDMTKLTPMTTWVASTYRDNATEAAIEPVTFTYTEVVRSEDGSYSTITRTKSFDHDTKEYRLTKFKAELKNWFNVDSTLFYYLYTHQYLMIDSRAKNAFPTYFASRVAGDGGDRWFWLPYDMDTAIGIDNKGKLSFDYNLEDTDKVDGADVFNGQDSVMWNNVRDAFDGELGEMYSKLRTQGLFSYNVVEERFETHQAKWSENIFNEDSKVKYIDTLKSGDNYLEMLQGGKVEQRKWWLYNRFKYMDSKYTAGDAKDDFIQFRAYVESGVDKPSVTITPYADIYATVSYANGAAGTKQKRAQRGVPVTIQNPFKKEEAETDQETYIYSASQLKSIGDISPFKPDTVKVGNATRLQELKVGSGAVGYTNPHLTELTLGNNRLLKLLDVRNCINLTNSIDIRNCINIEEAYFDNTQITELELPDGGILKKLHLPDSVTTLILKNQPLLEEFVLNNKANVRKLWLENISSEFIDAKEFINQMAEGSRVRLIGFNMVANNAEEIYNFYNKLDTMSGINAQGGNVDTAQVEGNILIENILYADYMALKDRYANVKIIPVNIICKVRFLNEGIEYNVQNIIQGNAAETPSQNPTKEPTQQYYYVFEKWDKDYSNIQIDIDINAVYSEHTQLYEVSFDLQSQIPEPIPSQMVPYGSCATKPEDPIIFGATFLGWFKEPNCVNEFDFNTPIIDTTILYAKWRDDSIPSASIERLTFNKFKYTLTDNIAVVAYAITNSSEEPTSWISITPQTTYVGEYTIPNAGVYYVWCKDAADKKANAVIRTFEISRDLAVGTELVVKEAEQIINNFVLQGTIINGNVSLDDHYENLVVKVNDEVVAASFTREILEDTLIKTECNPKTYTVKFDIGEYGEPVGDQYVVYLHKAEEPTPQYVIGKVVEGWYRDTTFTQQWVFTEDVVVGDTQLYAKWIDYQEPTKVKIFGSGEVKLNYNQSLPGGVTINWGDGSAEEKYEPYAGNVQLTHNYTTEAQYTIEILCTKGTHYIGTGYGLSVIMPASLIREIEFAWNMSSTAAYALQGAINLTSLNIPRYMTTLATGICLNCTGLTTINLPDNLKQISMQAFGGCTGLTGEFEIPQNVITIGEGAFSGCYNITNFKIHSGVTSIGDSAFSSCTGLTSFEIPAGISNIASGLLQNCTGITELDIPEHINSIGSSAFNGCSNLQKLIYRNNNLTVDSYSINKCYKLVTAGPIGGNYNIEFAWDLVIPSHAFETGNNGSKLNSVTLPDTITTIGSSAFSFCQALTGITLPISVTSIGDSAFFWCDHLREINLPANLKSLGYNAFYRCYSLTSMTIPASVETIGNTAFIYCFGINTIFMYNTISNNKIETPATSWFMNCSPTAIIHIQSSVVDPVTAYGSCWNYYSLTDTLTYYADL